MINKEKKQARPLYNKIKYGCHIRLPQQILEQEIILKRFQPYISLNTKYRAEAKNDLEEN